MANPMLAAYGILLAYLVFACAMAGYIAIDWLRHAEDDPHWRCSSRGENMLFLIGASVLWPVTVVILVLAAVAASSERAPRRP